jgi:glycyl-tRNA synthetase beta chain
VAEFLLELLSEEIPAGLQPWAEEVLAARFKALVVENGLGSPDLNIQCHSTPRRLWLYSPNIEAAAIDKQEERRGPNVDAPEAAVEGFLKSVSMSRDEVEERKEKKGTFLYATRQIKGRTAAKILADTLPKLITNFGWPKSMHWTSGQLRWIRPLRSILCLLDGKVVSFEVDGIKSGDRTSGHRVLGKGNITVQSFEDYFKKLAAAHVVPIRGDRAASVLGRAREIAGEEGLELIEDQQLVKEVAGLVEWPVPLLGSFDEAFLDLPKEVLISEMRNHQKYFALTEPASGKLAPRFIFVSNLLADDGGRASIKGNERVLSARLSDARFFWDQDRKTRLKDRLPALADIVFHEKLGSLADRAKRIEKLAKKIAKFVPAAKRRKAARAALLSKADLVTGMVGEFPELQGVMGGYYAAADGEDEAVSLAIREHYAPRGPSDPCPTAPISVALALADKLDLLISMFAIGERPTGSKDPFALRRAALGAIRLITENGLRVGLVSDLKMSPDLMAFIAERLKVGQREKGARHDLVDAVFSLSGEDDLVRLLTRVSALEGFVGSDESDNLLTGYKRAVNILRIEEKKDGTSYDGRPDPGLFELDEERRLHAALEAALKSNAGHLAGERFEASMAGIAALRKPIDAFFDHVTVNTDNPDLRTNRLRLLNRIRSSLNAVADFSKIEG